MDIRCKSLDNAPVAETASSESGTKPVCDCD